MKNIFIAAFWVHKLLIFLSNCRRTDTHLHVRDYFKLIPQILWRTQFICLFNNAKFNNESNLPLLCGLLDYPRMRNTILASECLQYKINNWQRVAGCRVIIGCRRRLKQSSSTADSLVISFGLNENHGLNPSKEIRKMWAHYWCPLTGLCACVCLCFFFFSCFGFFFFPLPSLRLEAKSVDWPLLLAEVDSLFHLCQQPHLCMHLESSCFNSPQYAAAKFVKKGEVHFTSKK